MNPQEFSGYRFATVRSFYLATFPLGGNVTAPIFALLAGGLPAVPWNSGLQNTILRAAHPGDAAAPIA